MRLWDTKVAFYVSTHKIVHMGRSNLRLYYSFNYLAVNLII